MQQTKKTIAKFNERKRLFFEKINKMDKPLAKLIQKKGRGLKLIKLKTKKMLQKTPQKYKGPKETTMSNCMPTKWTT